VFGLLGLAMIIEVTQEHCPIQHDHTTLIA